MDKKDGLWKGKTWDELGVEFKGNQEYSTRDVKVKCPACAEMGKTHLQDTPLSVIPTEGKGNCKKCGTVFIIEKNERAEKIDTGQKFKPVVPQNRTVLTEAGVKFFRSRRISQETIKKCRIAQSSNNVAFPYFKDEVLVNVKYRDIDEKKFSQSTGGTHMVFNYDLAMATIKKAPEGKRVVICNEGEIDSLSFVEAGFDASVSLDCGAPNPQDRSIEKKFECIDNSYDLFELADVVIIAVDNDVNGKLAEKELIRRFGSEKVKLIDFGKYKDGNEVLMYESTDYLRDLVARAKEVKVEGIFKIEDCYDELMDMITNGLRKGTSTYLPSIDRAWKWREGEVNVWTGYNNEGKSTLLRYLEMIKAVFDGVKIGLFIPEDIPLADFMESMIHMYVGKPTDPEMPDNIRATSEEIKEAIEFINAHFFVVYPDEDFSLDTIFAKFEYLVRRHGVRIIDIDPYNQLDHQYGGLREDLYVSKFMSRCKRFAIKHKVAFNIVAHQTRPERKADGTYAPPSKYNIKGGGTFSDKADNVLVVWRQQRYTDSKDPSVTFISEKIKKVKLVGEVDLYVDILYNWKTNRYDDQELGRKSPLEIQLAMPKQAA
jgi:twinkle protein